MKSVFTILSMLLTSASFASNTKMTAYNIDTKESSIVWTGSKATGSKHTGNISFKSGKIDVSGNSVKSGEFAVDMGSLTDTDLAGSPEYKAKLESHLKSDDFFQVTKFPESTFKITGIEKKNKDEYVVKGDLTLIGTSKPVEFPAKLDVTKDGVKGTATLTINRTNWGLKYGSKSFFKELVGDKIISDEFSLDLKIVAKK